MAEFTSSAGCGRTQPGRPHARPCHQALVELVRHHVALGGAQGVGLRLAAALGEASAKFANSTVSHSTTETAMMNPGRVGNAEQRQHEQGEREDGRKYTMSMTGFFACSRASASERIGTARLASGSLPCLHRSSRHLSLTRLLQHHHQVLGHRTQRKRREHRERPDKQHHQDEQEHEQALQWKAFRRSPPPSDACTGCPPDAHGDDGNEAVRQHFQTQHHVDERVLALKPAKAEPLLPPATWPRTAPRRSRGHPGC